MIHRPPIFFCRYLFPPRKFSNQTLDRFSLWRCGWPVFDFSTHQCFLPRLTVWSLGLRLRISACRFPSEGFGRRLVFDFSTHQCFFLHLTVWSPGLRCRISACRFPKEEFERLFSVSTFLQEQAQLKRHLEQMR